MFKNVGSQLWRVYAFDPTTNEPVTGDEAQITANIRTDAATTAVGDTNPTPLEDGYYEFTITADESNGDVLTILPESSTADVQVVGVPATIHTVYNNHGRTNTWYVETGGDNADDGHSVETALATITQAHTNAVDGDTIILGPGSHSTTAALSKSLKIVGAGRGDTTITRTSAIACDITATQFELRDLTVTTATSGSGVNLGNGSCQRLVLENVEIAANGPGLRTGATQSPVQIHCNGCEFGALNGSNANNRGIEIGGHTSLFLENCAIVNTQAGTSGGDTTHGLIMTTTNTSPTAVFANGCTFRCEHGGGMGDKDARPIIVAGTNATCHLHNCTVMAIIGSSMNSGDAVAILNTTGGTITITDCHLLADCGNAGGGAQVIDSSGGGPIYATRSSLTSSSTSSGQSVVLDNLSAGSEAVLTECVLVANETSSTARLWRGETVIHNCTFDEALLVDSGDMVVGGKFGKDTSIWYVDTTNGASGHIGNNQGSPLDTISNAITAASAGDTIIVAAGAYAETLTIDKSLTIRGSGDGVVVTGVTTGATVTADNVTLEKLNLVSTDANSAILATSSTNYLTLRQCTLNGGARWCIDAGTGGADNFVIEDCNMLSNFGGIEFSGFSSLLIKDTAIVLTGTSASSSTVYGVRLDPAGDNKCHLRVENSVVRIRRVEQLAAEGAIGIEGTSGDPYVGVVDSVIHIEQNDGAALGDAIGISADNASVRGGKIVTIHANSQTELDLQAGSGAIATVATVFDRSKTTGTIYSDFMPSLDLVDTVAYETAIEIIMAVLLGVATPSGNTVDFKQRDGSTNTLRITYGAAEGERTASTKL